MRVRAGIVIARSTPAIVACTPDAEDGGPQGQPDRAVGPRAAIAGHVGADRHQQQSPGHGERAPCDAARVEQGDHQDGADIVGDRQRRQEHPYPHGHPVAQKRNDAEREGDVRCHGDAPAGRAGAPGVERGIQQRGDHHAAQRPGDRERGPLEGGELAGQHLALDLESHQEEEHRHQAVVDQVVQRRMHRQRPDGQRELRLPEVLVGVRPRGVGPRQRHHDARQEDEAAGGLGLHEALKRREYALDERRTRGLVPNHLVTAPRHLGRRLSHGDLLKLAGVGHTGTLQ